MNPYRFFDDLDGYLAWAGEHFQHSPMFCAKHWAPAPVEGRNGVGASVAMTQIAMELMPADVLSGGPGAMNSWLANKVKPLCCVVGDDRMSELWSDWPPAQPPALQLARKARLEGDPMLAYPSRLHALADGDSDLYRHAMEEAGHLVEKATGEPFDPCSVCGWSPGSAG